MTKQEMIVLAKLRIHQGWSGVEIIKEVRMLTGWGLYESKDIWDEARAVVQVWRGKPCWLCQGTGKQEFGRGGEK